MICNELYDDPRRKGFESSYEDIVNYYPLMIKNEREAYIKCRIDAGDGTLEVKLPSKEIIRAERLDDDRIAQLLNNECKIGQWSRSAFEGSSAKLTDLYIDADDKIEVFLVEFFHEKDVDANPSAFDHDGNIWIYAEHRTKDYSLREIVLKLPDYEEVYAKDFDPLARKTVIDYLRSVEDIIVRLADITETDCGLRDYLNVKVQFIDRNAVLFERLTFDDRKEFERGQKYFIHCFTDALTYDRTQFYTYDGWDFVADNGYRLNYSEILNGLKKNAPIFAFRVVVDAQSEAPSTPDDILDADLSEAAKDMFDYNYLRLDELKYTVGGDVVEYYPLAIKNARETYIKWRVDAGDGTLEIKLPSWKKIRAERLDDDRIAQLLSACTPEKILSTALRVSGSRLIELTFASEEIRVFLVKFFNENDMSSAPSAFDHEHNIWIYAQRNDGDIILKLPSREIFYVDRFDEDAQQILLGYISSVEDIIVELAKLSGTDCTLREYLGVKVRLIDRRAVLLERMSFYNRKALERGQKYFIHCFNGYLFYDCTQLYTYDGRDFVADNGEILTYDHIFYVLGSEENPQIFIYKVAFDEREADLDFDIDDENEPPESMTNNVIVRRAALEKFLRADRDGKLPIFAATVDDTSMNVSIVRNEIDDGRIQIYIDAVVEQNGREIMSMPFIHLGAPQYSRYTLAELDDVDAFIKKFEQYWGRDSDCGWAVKPILYDLDDFLINFGKFDRFTHIYFEEAAQ